MVSDQAHRELAIDPTQSFIVQAPAGSGKTEILTQRFLRLLSTVEAPEQIIALTFTRKAANEMRERILLALQQAASGKEPSSLHQQQTYQYANQALARNEALNWQLLQQPSRLRITTIDALCQRLTQAIPLQEKQIPFAGISTHPKLIYLKAAQACLDYLLKETAFHEDLKQLLAHLDNRQDKIIQLFVELLTRRDQWLEVIYQAKSLDKHHFEQALQWIENHELSRLNASLPPHHQQALLSVIRHFSSLDIHPNASYSTLRDLASLRELERQQAIDLARLLLTKQQTLRKSFDHHVGLKRGVCPDKDYDQIKTASKAVLEQLSDQSEFLDALIRIKNLPAPEFDSNQWQVLQALFTILPLLVAHLQLVFSEQQEVDFSAIAQQALQALGTDEYPTDLALYLDYQIQHLLVDEFQDTSIGQFQLLTKLVQEWQPDDGRTLFIVGDPMQSIYRFRAAEVGLFLRAQAFGIGPVSLNPLTLQCNFRSNALLINWVNQQFKAIFPTQADMESGAIDFHPSISTKTANEHDFIQAISYENRHAEAAGLIEIIRRELAQYPEDEIAILVRSRTQLADIVQMLRVNRIPFQGVEIDLLAQLPHLQDIWTITQVLLMPANRLAWLAFLRSPWCGLSLADIHQIANFEKKQSIYVALSHLDKLTQLSLEGRKRAQFIYQVVHQALIRRHQQRLVPWIIQTLAALHWDKILTMDEREDLEQFWSLLEQHEQHNQIHDWQQFQEALNQLYSQRSNPARLKIMTIHKSKGLEFNTVILPGLSAKSKPVDKPLIRWLKLPTSETNLLLVSPVKATHQTQCLVYDYLEQFESYKDHYETQRLLYVAVTRAKNRLYLTDCETVGPKNSFRAFLNQQSFTPALEQEAPSIEQTQVLLTKLPQAFYESPSKPSSPQSSVMSMPMHNEHHRLIGIMTHDLLQWICTFHPQSIDDIPWKMAENQLKSSGLLSDVSTGVFEKIQNQIQTLFTDPIGYWIIQPHAEEKNEYELLVEQSQGMAIRIIDRTFCADGKRWIIDFKTGQYTSEQEKKHRIQVNEYAALLTPSSNLPIHCGLYYLSDTQWIHWKFNPG